jgi:hypothetical protein
MTFMTYFLNQNSADFGTVDTGHIEVGSVEERDEHLSQDIICAKKSKPHDERIQPQVLKRLDFKKVPFANARNTEETWSQCVDHTFGAIPRLTATVIEAGEAGEAQTPCLSVHHATPSGSSTGSGQKSLTPPSSSTEQVFDVESMDVSQYSAIDNWNAYKSTLFSCPYGSDSMLSNPGIPTLPDGFSSQDSAIRPFYNDPHIYGGSSSLDPNYLDNTPMLQSELNVQGCYQGRGFGGGNVDSTNGFPPYPI